MRSIVLAVCTLATVLSTSFANATIRLAADPGGRLIDYMDRFDLARSAGEKVVIDGACLSACTLAVGLVPRRNVCATRRAVLGFHAAWRFNAKGGRTTSGAATRAMMEMYPTNVRAWINQRGGLTPHMIFLRGRALTNFVPVCRTAEPASGTHGPQLAQLR